MHFMMTHLQAPKVHVREDNKANLGTFAYKEASLLVAMIYTIVISNITKRAVQPIFQSVVIHQYTADL